MKYTIILSTFSLLFSLSISSCSKKSTAPVKNDKVQVKEIPAESDIATPTKGEIKPNPTKGSDKPADCHGERKTIKTFTDEKGTIMKVGQYYVISMERGSKRYKPCEINPKYREDGKAVTFSGDILEIYPNERLIGTPFRLTRMTN